MNDSTLYILAVNPSVLLTDLLEGKVIEEPKFSEIPYLPLDQIKLAVWGSGGDIVTGSHIENLTSFNLSFVRDLHDADLCGSIINRFTYIRIVHALQNSVVADQRYEVSAFIDQHHPFYCLSPVRPGPIEILECDIPDIGGWGDDQDVL